MLKFITLKKKEIKIQGNRGLPCLGICNKTSRLFLVHCSWAWSSGVPVVLYALPTIPAAVMDVKLAMLNLVQIGS